jgi:hypothetical protein
MYERLCTIVKPLTFTLLLQFLLTSEGFGHDGADDLGYLKCQRQGVQAEKVSNLEQNKKLL